MPRTVGQLKAIIKDLDDDMLVGNSGRFSEYLECFDITVQSVRLEGSDSKVSQILCISIQEDDIY